MPTDGQRIQKRTPATVALQVSSATQPVRPGKLLKMIVWRGGTRSDRASIARSLQGRAGR